jgi:hypothetical protein
MKFFSEGLKIKKPQSFKLCGFFVATIDSVHCQVLQAFFKKFFFNIQTVFHAQVSLDHLETFAFFHEIGLQRLCDNILVHNGLGLEMSYKINKKINGIKVPLYLNLLPITTVFLN